MLSFYENMICSLLKLSSKKSLIDKEISSKLKELSDSENKSIDLIVNEVNNKGYVILDSALTPDTLALLKKEYDNFFLDDEAKFYNVDKHDGARCIRVKPFWSLRNFLKYPVTLSFFRSALCEKVAKNFYGFCLYRLNFMSEIFVHNTCETNQPLSHKLHWDRHQTLKFWVYLDDIGIDNGPMRVERDSVGRNSIQRLSLGHHTKLLGGVDNLVIPVEKVVNMTAPAGSILIHNTDASHGATSVSKGYERKIMRGHCRVD